MRREAGFSLIELMVVLAIMAVIMGLAAPAFTESTARKRLEGIAAELSTDLQYAKTQAASLNTNVTLVTSANGYVVSGTATLKTVALDTTTTLTDAVTVTFEPHRTFPTNAATVNLSHSQTSSTLRVNVDAVGRIQTCSPSGTFPGYSLC